MLKYVEIEVDAVEELYACTKHLNQGPGVPGVGYLHNINIPVVLGMSVPKAPHIQHVVAGQPLDTFHSNKPF